MAQVSVVRCRNTHSGRARRHQPLVRRTRKAAAHGRPGTLLPVTRHGPDPPTSGGTEAPPPGTGTSVATVPRAYGGHGHVRGEAERVGHTSLVVGEDDRVTATGRLVRTETGDWFEPSMPVRLPGGVPRTVSGPWQGAVRIAGANFDDLSARFEHHGAVEGYATLTGIWSADQLLVDHQAPPPRDRRRHEGSLWQTPPCPAPEGGWPHLAWRGGDKNLEYEIGDLRHTGAAVAQRIFRPGADQAVLVVAAVDLDAVEAQLRPQLGPLLCVVPSKWTQAELEAVRAHLHVHHEQWHLYEWGYGQTTSDGQAQVSARLTRVLPEVAAWAATLPPGILDLEPWLTRAYP